jgi:hypothetical protein
MAKGSKITHCEVLKWLIGNRKEKAENRHRAEVRDRGGRFEKVRRLESKRVGS